eukprot:6157805-Ditylum_brightwellii.AAC.1
MDKDAYPCTLPQAIKLFEQFKPEALADATMSKPGGDTGVAFTQTEGYTQTCFNCRAKGHTVNECPRLNTTERDKFWADRKANCNANLGVSHAAVGDKSNTPAPAANAPAPAPTPADFEWFQKYLALVEPTKDLDVGFAQVGNLVEDKVSLASIHNKPVKRFTLNPHK